MQPHALLKASQHTEEFLNLLISAAIPFEESLCTGQTEVAVIAKELAQPLATSVSVKKLL